MAATETHGTSRTTHITCCKVRVFDKEKEQNRLKAVGLVSDIGSQAADIARTQGEITAINEAQGKMKNVPAEDREAARAQWEKANPGKTASDDDINGQVYQNYYNTAFNATGMGTGGTVQRGIQAATAALTALAGGGDMAGALAGASAPELAHLLKPTEDNPAVNTIAHAILGGAVAALQGNSVAAGAAGAASGELAAHAIAGLLYPDVKDLSTLTEDQKQTVSALASISAGMAGGLAGGDTAGAAAGAAAGKNAVESNALSNDDDEDEYTRGNRLPKLFDVNPMMKVGILDDEGDPLRSGGGIAKSGKVSAATKEHLISSANEPINGQGMTAAARAWEKHAGRVGGTFEPLKGNVIQKNTTAEKFVNEVLSNPSTVRTELSRGGVEYRQPNGQGVRYNADGSFSGFLDPKR